MSISKTAKYNFLELVRNEMPGFTISGDFEASKTMTYKCPNGHIFTNSANKVRDYIKGGKKGHLCRGCKAVERIEGKLIEIEGTKTCEYDVLHYENNLTPATLRHHICGKTFSMYPNVMYGKKKGFKVCLICHQKEHEEARERGIKGKRSIIKNVRERV